MSKELEQFNNINMNLHLLSEECKEVGLCVSKALRFGLTDIDPDTPGAVPKYQQLEQEIGDVLAIVDILVNNKIGVTPEGISKAKAKKLKKLANYYGTGEFAKNGPLEQ
jgi:NTP pyrophosphatase (non-canonical NTP hydrolase)